MVDETLVVGYLLLRMCEIEVPAVLGMCRNMIDMVFSLRYSLRMEKKLKQLLKNQIQQTEIPAYFTWNDNRIHYNWDSKKWVVSSNGKQLYNGLFFDDALEVLFYEEGLLR